MVQQWQNGWCYISGRGEAAGGMTLGDLGKIRETLFFCWTPVCPIGLLGSGPTRMLVQKQVAPYMAWVKGHVVVASSAISTSFPGLNCPPPAFLPLGSVLTLVDGCNSSNSGSLSANSTGLWTPITCFTACFPPCVFPSCWWELAQDLIPWEMPAMNLQTGS